MNSIQQDTMQRIYDSRIHLIIATAWVIIELILATTLLADHPITDYLTRFGIDWKPFFPLTLVGCGIIGGIWFAFARSKYMFLVFVAIPLSFYATLNIILVARGMLHPDRMPLMMVVGGGLFLSWLFAERDELAQSELRKALSELETLRRSREQSDA